MDGRPLGSNRFRLPPDVVQRCHRFGERCARHYREGRKEASRFYATRDIENDPVRQAQAKMAEGQLRSALW
jgi:hypothetical protein